MRSRQATFGAKGISKPAMKWCNRTCGHNHLQNHPLRQACEDVLWLDVTTTLTSAIECGGIPDKTGFCSITKSARRTKKVDFDRWDAYHVPK